MFVHLIKGEEYIKIPEINHMLIHSPTFLKSFLLLSLAKLLGKAAKKKVLLFYEREERKLKRKKVRSADSNILIIALIIHSLVLAAR